MGKEEGWKTLGSHQSPVRVTTGCELIGSIQLWRLESGSAQIEHQRP